MRNEIYDCIIVGAGPSGISASIQLHRSGHKILLIEKNKIGGLARNANLIENYIGFPKAIPGKDLVKLFKQQLKKHKIKTLKQEVLEINEKGELFKITTNQLSERKVRSKASVTNLYSKTLIIATGTTPKKAKIPCEGNLKNKIFYEIADLPKIKGKKEFIIIGSGDAAFDYALNLAKKHKITILARKPRCLDLLKQRVEKHKNIKLRQGCVVKKIKERNGKIEVITKDKTLITDYIMITTGRKPLVPRTKIHKKKHELFFVGDVGYGKFRQIHIATGDGLLQAMRVLS